MADIEKELNTAPATAQEAAAETAAAPAATEPAVQETPAAKAEPEPHKEKDEPKKKKGWPIGLRILLWLAIIALVIFLTLFIVALIVPDERINNISDLINYLVTEFNAL